MARGVRGILPALGALPGGGASPLGAAVSPSAEQLLFDREHHGVLVPRDGGHGLPASVVNRLVRPISIQPEGLSRAWMSGAALSSASLASSVCSPSTVRTSATIAGNAVS